MKRESVKIVIHSILNMIYTLSKSLSTVMSINLNDETTRDLVNSIVSSIVSESCQLAEKTQEYYAINKCDEGNSVMPIEH